MNQNEVVMNSEETKPVAWRYMLGDGKWRYQREWSNGADMHPVYEMTPEALAALPKQG